MSVKEEIVARAGTVEVIRGAEEVEISTKKMNTEVVKKNGMRRSDGFMKRNTKV